MNYFCSLTNLVLRVKLKCQIATSYGCFGASHFSLTTSCPDFASGKFVKEGLLLMCHIDTKLKNSMVIFITFVGKFALCQNLWQITYTLDCQLIA